MVIDKDVERLADEIAQRTGEDKLEVIRKALEERRVHLNNLAAQKKQRWQNFLEREVWSTLPDNIKGEGVSQKEQDKILGYDS